MKQTTNEGWLITTNTAPMMPSGTMESKTLAFQRIIQALKSTSTMSDPIYWNVHWHQEKLIFEMETTLSDLRTRHLISRIIDLLAAHKTFHKCAMRIKTDYETRHIYITVLKY